MLKRTLSSDSWEYPWDVNQRPRRPPLVVPQSQSGRNVTITCFLLCFIAVLLLSSGLIMAGVSIWSILRKVPYFYLVEIKVDVPYFSLPAALLCFPSFWIAMSIHNNRKKYEFLHLLIVLLIISAALLLTGASLGLVFVSRIKANTTTIVTSYNSRTLNNSLQITLEEYGTNVNYKFAWNLMQTRLACCGVMNYNDWLKYGGTIPSSCCEKGLCNSNNTYLRGCLDSMSRDLTWHKNVMSSQSYMVIVVQVVAMIVAITVYFAEKRS